MRKLLLTVLLTLFILSLSAQKKFFFESVEINSHVYLESVSFTKEGWLRQFRSAYPPSAQNFDSLNNNQSYVAYKKDWGGFRINVKGGYGIQVRGLRSLQLSQNNSSHEWLWKTGLGYRTFTITSDPLSNYEPWIDTTRTYFFESEKFQLRQGLIDLYNAIVYSPHIGILHVSIGLGFQASFSINNKIKEDYSAREVRWNSSRHYWDYNTIADEVNILPARSTMMYSLTIPFGWGIDLSKRVSWEPGGEYFHAMRLPRLSQKKSTDGVMFQLKIRYKL